MATQLAETRRQLSASTQQTKASAAQLDDTNRQLVDAQARLAEMQRQMAELDKTVKADKDTIAARLSDLAKLAEQIDGVYGARMTGGGFGGCTIALVQTARVEEFQTRVGEGYERSTGRKPEIYICSAADGVGRVA